MGHGEKCKSLQRGWGPLFYWQTPIIRNNRKNFFIFENFETQSQGQLAPKSGAARA
jgi:hypothetical protein